MKRIVVLLLGLVVAGCTTTLGLSPASGDEADREVWALRRAADEFHELGAAGARLHEDFQRQGYERMAQLPSE